MTPVLIALFLAPQHPLVFAEWRKLDAQGRACTSCHSPDGIEVARYAFSRDDIERRASRHLPPADCKRIAQEFATARRSLEPLADPMEARPMQPGGEILPGTTPGERDSAFLKGLEQKAPSLGGPRPTTIGQARKLQRDLMSVDLGSLRIGIEQNRLSEDSAHGPEHASLAAWIPDLPVPQVERFFDLEDTYLGKPTWENLCKLDTAVDKAWRPTSPIEQLAKAKFRSLLVFQHRLRSEGTTPTLLPGNPLWQVADFGRMYANADPRLLGLPADIQESKSGGPTLDEQMHSLRRSWYWLGWLADPGLTHSGGDDQTRGGDYFVQQLMADGYPGHAAFVLARKMWGQAEPGPKDRPWEMRFSFFLLGRPLSEVEPSDPDERKLFRSVVGNVLCTTALILEDETKRTGRALFKESTVQQLSLAKAYLRHCGEPADALLDRVANVVRAARRWP